MHLHQTQSAPVLFVYRHGRLLSRRAHRGQTNQQKQPRYKAVYQNVNVFVCFASVAHNLCIFILIFKYQNFTIKFFKVIKFICFDKNNGSHIFKYFQQAKRRFIKDHSTFIFDTV